MAVWAPIKGYEGLYLVSDEGDVYALPKTVNNGWGVTHRKGKLLKAFLRGKGGLMYEGVCLCRDGTAKRMSVHRLVAEAFAENEDPEKFTVVNHKDRNTLNNRAGNLEWCDQQYNNEYSHNKRVCQILDGVKIAEYRSVSYASEITGISRTAINNVLTGWSKSAGGYSWKYAQKGCDDLSH